MGTLKIIRKLQWFGMFRKMSIEVDGEFAGSIRVCDSLEIDLPTGIHEVQALMSWVGSPPHRVAISDSAISTVGVSLPYQEARAATGNGDPGGDHAEFARSNPGIVIYDL